jgi:hypothetical protein
MGRSYLRRLLAQVGVWAHLQPFTPLSQKGLGATARPLDAHTAMAGAPAAPLASGRMPHIMLCANSSPPEASWALVSERAQEPTSGAGARMHWDASVSQALILETLL